MKKILYIGIFSGTNIGDLVISDQLPNHLKTLSGLPVDLMDFYTLEKVRGVFYAVEKDSNSNIFSKIKISLLGNSIGSNAYSIYRKVYSRTYTQWIEYLLLHTNNVFKEYCRIIDEYDIICIGGGNLLMSISHNIWAIKINKLVKIAKAKNKKVIILSVGAGPFQLYKSRLYYKEALSIVDYIAVRDMYSKKIIEDLLGIDRKIDISGDPVLLLENRRIRYKSQNFRNPNNINIAISIMPFGKKDFLNLPSYKNYDYYLDMYKNIIECLHYKYPTCIFNLFSTEYSDYDTISELYEHILKNSTQVTKENLLIEYIESLDNLLSFYQSQDLLIGTRMHSLIIAYTQSLPILAISWQNKVSSFMEYVNLNQYCFNLNEINEKIDEIYYKVNELLINNLQTSNDPSIMYKTNIPKEIFE